MKSVEFFPSVHPKYNLDKRFNQKNNWKHLCGWPQVELWGLTWHCKTVNIYKFIRFFATCEYKTVYELSSNAELYDSNHFLCNTISLNLSLQLAFIEHNLTARFCHAPTERSLFHHQNVDTALPQPEHRLIHKINKPRQTSCTELLILPLTLVLHFKCVCVISCKLSLVVVLFTFTSFQNTRDEIFF